MNLQSTQLDVNTLPLNRSAMIDASAGTGKTYTITYLVLRLLLGSGKEKGYGRPLSLDELLVVTFTDAAASDLRERVREKIRSCRLCFERVIADQADNKDDFSDFEPQTAALILELTNCKALTEVKNGDAYEVAVSCIRRLSAAERSIDEAAVCTIHSFCNRSLNRIYSFEAAEAFDEEMCSPQSLTDLYTRSDHEVWRRLFYTEDAKAHLLLDLLGLKGPEDESLRAIEDMLSKVRITKDEAHTPSFCGYAVTGDEIAFFKGCHKSKLRARLYEYAEYCKKRLDAQSVAYKSAVQAGRDLFGSCQSFLEFVAADKADLSSLSKAFTPKKTPFNSYDLFAAVFSQCQAEEPSIDDFMLMAGEKWLSSDISLSSCISRVGYNAFEKKATDAQRMIFAKFDAVLQDICKSVKDCEILRSRCRLCARTAVEIMLLRQRELNCVKEGKLTFDELLFKLDTALHDDKKEIFCRILRTRYPVAIIDEFQDTDPIQFSVFSRLYLENEKDLKKKSLKEESRDQRAICFLIGDPKQSIYRFRGADINSYVEARNAVTAVDPTALYTLNVNYRSSYGVVEGVNLIFRGFDKDKENTDPFFDRKDSDNALTCPEVKAHAQSCPSGSMCGKYKFFFKKDNKDLSSGNFVVTDSHPQEEKKSVGGKRNDGVYLAEAAAQSISEILSYGYLMDKSGNCRRVENRDIAVLVRTSSEHEKIKNALEALRIPSVYYSDKGSVLTKTEFSGRFGTVRPSECASWILYFMEACMQFSSRARVLKLMASPMAALSCEEFRALYDEHGIEEEAELLRRCRTLWNTTGFVAGFSLWVKRHEVKKRLLKSGCERELTDLMHIAELIQARHRDCAGNEAQLTWFKRMLEDGSASEDPEAFKRRLDSERSQVSIYTVHKSKGLEFPVTVLPFLYDTNVDPVRRNDDEIALYYDKNLKRRILALDDEDGSKRMGAYYEDLHESARLLYVALTRACAANFLFIMKDAEGKEDKGSALVRELRQCAGNPSVKEALSLFEKADPQVFCVCEREKKTPDLLIEERLKSAEQKSSFKIKDPSTLEKGDIRRDFSVSSYSSLAAGLHDHMIRNDDEKILVPDLNVRTEALNAATFPRGTEAGTFLHKTLQFMDFIRAYNEEDYLRKYLESSVRDNHGGDLLNSWRRKNKSVETDPYEALEEWFLNILATPLKEAGENFHLGALSSTQKHCEMDFLIPSEQVSSEEINKICKDSARDFLPGKHDDLVLSNKQVKGFVTGSIDLMFRGKYQDHDAYFVVDYKSTYLGEDDLSYNAAALTSSVFDPRNRYDLQYLFYSLALHRFLKTRIKDYDYERDFGGVFYLYLRGMGPAGNGVFYTRPKLEIIEKLDDLLLTGSSAQGGDK